MNKLQREALAIPPEDLDVFIDCLPSHPDDRSKFSGVMIVGEAPGAKEQEYGIPFHPDGVAGAILRETLLKVDTKREHHIGLDPESCWITNVFKERPPRNRINEFFDTEEWEETKDIPKRVGRHLIGGYRDSLVYLWKEILEYAKPDLILACGAVPLWFFTGEDRIGRRRGQLEIVPAPHDMKVFFTYHPMATVYNRDSREVFDQDVAKFKQIWMDTHHDE